MTDIQRWGGDHIAVTEELWDSEFVLAADAEAHEAAAVALAVAEATDALIASRDAAVAAARTLNYYEGYRDGAKGGVIVGQRDMEAEMWRITDAAINDVFSDGDRSIYAKGQRDALAARTLTADDPEPAVGSVVLDANGEAWQHGVHGDWQPITASAIRDWPSVLRAYGPVTLIYDAAAPQDESRGHRVWTGAQSVTFDGKPHDPCRPATSAEADAIDAQAAEFLQPLLDSGAIVKSGHARTCGIWRITAAVARCTCKPTTTEDGA